MSRSFRMMPEYTSKVERAKRDHEQAQRRECVDRAFVRIETDAVQAEIDDANRAAEVTRVLLQRRK